MNSSKDTQLIWEAYLNERQYPNRHKYHAIISELVDTLGHHFIIDLLKHADADMLMIEADEYTKREPGDTKTRDARKDLIGSLAYTHNQISKESDPDKKAELQNKYKTMLRYAKRYGVSQADVDSHSNHSGPGSSSDKPGDYSYRSSNTGTDYGKDFYDYTYSTHSSDDDPYDSDAAKKSHDDMQDWFNEYEQTRNKNGARRYDVPVDVYVAYDNTTRDYKGLRVKQNSTDTPEYHMFSRMAQNSREFDQMFFEKWVSKYKTSAEDWMRINKPKMPEDVTNSIMSGEDLVETWDWFVNNYTDSAGNKFNAPDENHLQALPLAGSETAEWKTKHHNNPPPEPEPKPEAEPEKDRESYTNDSSKVTKILNDIRSMLKRGKAAGGRIQNFLPLAGEYDPTTPEGQQVADDTETLLDLIDLLRQLNKASKQT